MKLIPFSLLLLIVTFVPGLAQPPLKDKEILFDFRVVRRVDSSPIPAATRRMVLSKVFRKYLTDTAKCNPQFETDGNNDPLQAARTAGQIVPDITDVANGSFTAPGQKQTLYVISVSECNASHADNFGTKRVAIFSGQRLLADVDVSFRSTIVKKTDLDSDGVDELLMTTGDMAQGTLTETGALLSFQNGQVKVIEDFGTVNEDSCASGFPGSSARASVVSFSNAVLGKMPKLKIDNYERGCSSPKRWRFVSTGKQP